MPKTPKGELARERIFKAGVVLFAQKGYHAVGVREIAAAAGVKLPMISYYFGGKVELLKEIISMGFARYYDSINQAAAAATGTEQRALAVAKGMIRFFREEPELSLVSFTGFPVDMAEIHKLRTSLIKKHQPESPYLFAELKLNVADSAMIHIFTEFMYAIVRNHFQYRYSLNFYPSAAQVLLPQKKNLNKKSADQIFDDVFYERYAEIVAKALILSARGMKSA